MSRDIINQKKKKKKNSVTLIKYCVIDCFSVRNFKFSARRVTAKRKNSAFLFLFLSWADMFTGTD